ncbi:hypothetical protein [Pedobacter sp. ASV28]|uniref:hypothetical protein n=1 Tax=Pedobacter sp. ASV28 TaxID=2795123 RepID=UPI001E43DF47|nr:hypothetical protein [Pedobacter sp. ASV28]
MAILIHLPKLPAAAMALFPFILVKEAGYKNDSILINHELIHHRQQLELLIVPFYIMYFLNYAFNLLKYRNHHQAYSHILFEKEAYAKEHDLSYLGTRKPFAWYSFFKS